VGIPQKHLVVFEESRSTGYKLIKSEKKVLIKDIQDLQRMP
jgi:hypothetical protein